MNKAELVAALAEHLDGDRRAAASAVDGLLDVIVRAVQAGDSVSLTGFGVFERRQRAARTARNPRTGQAIQVPAAAVPAFRPGALFRDVVSGARELGESGRAVGSARAARGVGAGGSGGRARSRPVAASAAAAVVAGSGDGAVAGPVAPVAVADGPVKAGGGKGKAAKDGKGGGKNGKAGGEGKAGKNGKVSPDGKVGKAGAGGKNGKGAKGAKAAAGAGGKKKGKK